MTIPGSGTPAFRFALRTLAWGLGLFSVLRLAWFEDRVLLPLTALQAALGANICGRPASPVQATLACSGADVTALCLAVILAYPVRWSKRMAGAAVGLALILALNTLRIGTLGRVAGSPRLFEVLHVYVWPTVLATTVAAYVLGWILLADRRPTGLRESGVATGRLIAAPTGRFVLIVLVLVPLFVAAAPFYHHSEWLLAAGSLVTRAAAVIVSWAGIEASARANVLIAPGGSFVVTPECLASPLIPVYAAAILAAPATWRRRIAGFAAAVPLFFGVGVARLLVVAVPEALVGTHVVAVHAFNQFLFATVVVTLAAAWAHGPSLSALRRAVLGVAAGLIAGRILAWPLDVFVMHPVAMLAARALGAPEGVALADPQGALALLPPFQAGFYVALALAVFAHLGWRRHAVGAALLCAGQGATVAVAVLLQQAAGIGIHVRETRALAVAVPLLVLAVVSWGKLRPVPRPAIVAEAGAR
jgi:exosortase/archaeosortase family protein